MSTVKAKEKLERSLGMRLGLKASRCNSPKCVMVRRPQKPGEHGKKRRRAPSEYGLQLLEKQRIRASYAVKEKRFRNIVKKALNQKGVETGEEIISSLERELGNVVFRIGFAPSRIMGQKLVGHGHFSVNGRKVTIPSYKVRPGDVIAIKPTSKDKGVFREIGEYLKHYEAPEWIKLNKDAFQAEIKSLPQGVEAMFDMGLVIDYYSK